MEKKWCIMADLEQKAGFRECQEYSFFIVSFVFFSLLLIPVSADVCCTAANNASAYCTEFASSTVAYSAGCQVVSNDVCEFTDCAYVGCCVNDCSWKRKDQCSNGTSFYAFTLCSDDTVAECSPSCCVTMSGGQPFPQEGYGQGNWKSYCEDNGGDWSPDPCSQIGEYGAYGKISGYVKDTSGITLAGATVYAGTYSTTTNGNGFYRFNQVPISPSGFSMKAYYTGYMQQNTVTAPVTKDTETTASDIIMASDTNSVVEVSGRVTDSLGNGIAGVIIVIDDDGDSTFTDVLGYYTLRAIIDAGTYNLEAKKSNYNTGSTSIAVEPGLPYDIDFTLTPSSGISTCDNGVVDGVNEECDSPDDSACPGQCQADCTCPLTCEEKGYFCADADYQCTNNNGVIMSAYNVDCEDNFNARINGGYCCNTPVTSLPTCIYGETAPGAHIGYTDIPDQSQPYCKCGDYIEDVTGSTTKYCCLIGGARNITTSECENPGTVQGLVSSASDSTLQGVRVQLSAIYQATTNNTSPLNYKFQTVAPGRYTVTASKLGYNDYSATIDVTSGNVLTHNIYMTPQTGIDTPLTLTLSHVKGKPYVNLTITVSDYSAIAYYEIYKDSVSIAHINASEISTVTIFVDNMTQWGTAYSYNVTAYSSFSAIDSDAKSITTGDSACEGIMDNAQFCASSNCFNAGTQTYCHENDDSPFKYRLICNSNNQLAYATGSASGSSCPSGEYCVETADGVTECSGNDHCETIGMPPNFGSYTSELGNIFGLYYDQSFAYETCHQTSSGGYKFCYYDYYYSDVLSRTSGSYRTVDQCLSCQSDGFCYDYQSQDACQEDHCNFGRTYNTTCKWKDTYSEIGKGICYSDDTATTDFCGMCDITNPVFYNSNCSQSVCDLLGLCVSTSGETSCDPCTITSTCDQFDGNQQACEGNPHQPYDFTGYPQNAPSWSGSCNSSTSITYSDDTCGVGFCKYLSSSDLCIKDANDDDIHDCNGTADVACGQDRSIPTTLMSGQNYISLSRSSLSFTIDSVAAKTFYCFSDLGGYCCPDKQMSGSSITLPNLYYNYSNMEAKKKLWFYSATTYGNPEPIKNITITIDNKPPNLTVSYQRVNSTLSLNGSDVIVTVVSHETARQCSDSLVGQGTYSQMTDDVIDTTKTVTFPNIADGSYIYTIQCEDMYGNTNTAYKNIDVDRVRVIENPQPNFVTLAYSKINFSLETPGEEYACYFKMFDPRTETETRFPASDVYYQSGSYHYYSNNNELSNSDTYQYYFSCYDDATKSDLADRENIIFTIDKNAPTTNAFVDVAGIYENIQSGVYYTNPIIKINCSDPKQGPPIEFGCSKITYCFSQTSCSPSNIVQTDSYEFDPTSLVVNTGQYYVCMKGEDAGGNQETAHCDTINIDLLPPGLTITQPAQGNNTVVGLSNFEFAGTWVDQNAPTSMVAKIVNEKGFQMTIDNIVISGTSGSGTFRGAATLSDLYAGINTLTVVAVDQSGNYDTISVNFYYDIYPPTISKAEVYGENIVAQQGWFYVDGTGGQNVEIELGFFKLSEDQSILQTHEYGHRVKPELSANDDNFTDLSSMFGTDVTGSVTITSQSNPAETYTQSLTYNSSANNYYSMFTDVFDIGYHTVKYDVQDKWGLASTYNHSILVNDTIAPYFRVRIYDDQGQNVSSVQYGTYEVKILPSEPIGKIHYLNFSFSGKTKSVELTVDNGTLMEGTLTISTSDLDMRELVRQVATFDILGEDTHGRYGSTITSINSFYITTAGPMQPIILTPLMGQGNTTFYSTSTNYTVEGIVYEDTDIGLRDGRVLLMKNTIVPDYADGNWIREGEVMTRTNGLHHEWEYAKYNDVITFRNNNTINLHDYNSSFTVGRYFGFEGHPMNNRKLYKIISRDFTGRNGVKELYDITVEPDLVGFQGFNPQDTFEDNIDIYDSDAPDGWFDVNVSLQQGENHFYARAYDGPNEGSYSAIFTLVYDNLNPVLINTSPSPWTLTGDVQVPIYAYIDPTGSNVSSYVMTLNGTPVSASLTYNPVGYAKIEYNYGGDLGKGNYTMGIIASDMAGNTLNHQWQFTIDPGAPLGPSIQPSGVINDQTPTITITFPQEVEINKSTLESTTGSYQLNLTDLLSFDGTSYYYDIPITSPLIQGDYEVKVDARKVVGEDFGNMGSFSQQFSVDITPPVITQTNSPIYSPNPPVNIVVQTDELAVCRYDFYDVAYDSMQYTPRVESFGTSHTLPVYYIPSLSTTAYVRCEDQAGNQMTDRAIITIDVDSLLYPPPAIYVPENFTDVTTDSRYMVVGSTFDDSDPLSWVPSVNLKLFKSNYFYSKEVTFDKLFYTQSLPETNITALSPAGGFFHDQVDNAIIIDDTRAIFQKDKYVEFTDNRRNNYTAYQIKSVIDVSGAYGAGKVKVTFYGQLPADLDTGQTIYIYDQKAPPGWFGYSLSVDEGNNFFYALATNNYGDGEKTEVYNIVKDTTDPILEDEFPRDGEIIGEESIEISIIGDGTNSQIVNADFKVDGIPINPDIDYIEDFESKIKYPTTQSNALHTIYVKAYDGGGNSAETEWSFTINARAPSRPTITPSTYINDTTPTLDIQFSEQVDLQSAKLTGTGVNDDFTSVVQDTSTTHYIYPVTTQLAEGEYLIHVRASKKNITDPVAGYWYENFFVDLTPPRILSIPSTITTSQIPAKFLMITNEDAKCRFTERGDGVSYYDMEYDLDSDFIEYHYAAAQVSVSSTTIYVRCQDEAGNVMQSSRAVGINQNPIQTQVCGDGDITGTEECDGNNWGVITGCQNYGNFESGPGLKCDPISCHFDVSECTPITGCQDDSDCSGSKICVSTICIEPHCVNQVKDADEQGVDCGGADCVQCTVEDHCTNGVKDQDEEDVDCGGEDCAECIECGNNQVERGETCDGNDFGSITECGDLPGFVSGTGTLTCDLQTCHFDTSQCIKVPAVCGNGIVEEGEQCEGGVGAKTCEYFGFDNGSLSCVKCMYNTSQCRGIEGNYSCEDGHFNPGEQCDPPDFSITKCNEMSASFVSGALSCDENCMLSTESCVVNYQCNDGIVNPGEECDSGIQTANCVNFDRFGGGSLGCGSDCLFNTSSCAYIRIGCPNGFVDSGEICDPQADMSSVSCEMFDSYQSGEIGCNPDCKSYDLSGCSRAPRFEPECGDNAVDEELGEQCDGTVIPSNCTELGYSSGDYPDCYAKGSANECQYDVSPCGVSVQCVSGQTKLCNEISASYIDGTAGCQGGFYDMSTCWSGDFPLISVSSLPATVSDNYVDISGTIEKAKNFLMYVNGILKENMTYSTPASRAFAFNNVYLSKTTATGNGINNITFIAYGAFPTINFMLTKEVIVDVTGPSVQILEPVNMRTSNRTPEIKINTSKQSTCEITYTSFSTEYTQQFTTTTGYVHRVTIQNPLLEDQDNDMTIVCVDATENNVTLEITIHVDTIPPKITDVILLNPDQTLVDNSTSYKYLLVYEDLNSKIKVLADSLVRCRYGIDTQDYSSMIDYDALINSYIDTWETANEISSTKTSLSVYTICEDEAGLQSDPYRLRIDVDPSADLIVTRLNSKYVSTGSPDLNVSTNRLADCKVKYGAEEEQMDREATYTGAGYKHSLNVADLGGLNLEHGITYNFEITCEVTNPELGLPAQTIFVTLVPDLVPPSVVIVNPDNNDVFNTQKINVEVQTEANSTVEMHVNDTLQGNKNSQNGNIVFEAVLREGRNDIEVAVVDKAGNSNGTSISVYYMGQAVLPEVRGTYPANAEVTHSVNKIYAFVWTAFGVTELDLSRSDMILRNSQGTRIVGDKAFIPGGTMNPVGNFTYDLDSLSDGVYDLNITVIDEFGNEGLNYYIWFKVDRAVPVINITSPIKLSSNGPAATEAYSTKNNTFLLAGTIDSSSDLNKSYFQINKGNGFGSELSLDVRNGVFSKAVTLDPINDGQTMNYILKITVANVAGHTEELQFDIYHDRQAPEPLTVVVE